MYTCHHTVFIAYCVYIVGLSASRVKCLGVAGGYLGYGKVCSMVL